MGISATMLPRLTCTSASVIGQRLRNGASLTNAVHPISSRNSLSPNSSRNFQFLYSLFVNDRFYSTMSQKTLTIDNINPNIKKMEYAVRGPLVIRAAEIEKELKKGAKKPFKEVIRANIGDCQAMGQHPITFIRQVLTCCTIPDLMKDNRFPSDVQARAKAILESCGGNSVGAYSDSSGVEVIRRNAAKYIEKRDGIPAKYEDVLLSTGATESIKSILALINNPHSGKPAGVLIPIPQYPLYSATLAEYALHQVNYYLEESNEWALNISELKRSINEAKQVCHPRALVVINPGNPTGSVLTEENIREVIKFAHEENLFILADEVYQHNIYGEGMKFHSFKKVLTEMGPPYSQMELASFMSASKGYMGECGLRGGYCEVINLDPEVKRMLLKAISAKLCSSVLGQAAMDCIVNPPEPNEPSYPLFCKEKDEVLKSLKLKANMVYEAFNSMTGMQCNKVAGAMYAFPKLQIPQKAIEKAKSLGQTPDFFYAMELLETSGICIVPGSGFGQIPGTYHFRTTILPPADKLKIMTERLREFNEKFMKTYQ